MTDHTPLSPAAQAVWNAADGACMYSPDRDDTRLAVAAALRAAADQVVPESKVYRPSNDGTMRREDDLWIIRRGIYAIATELESCQ